MKAVDDVINLRLQCVLLLVPDFFARKRGTEKVITTSSQLRKQNPRTKHFRRFLKINLGKDLVILGTTNSTKGFDLEFTVWKLYVFP